MISVIAIILSGLGIAFMEVPSMRREKLNKELAAFLVLLTTGIVLAALVSIHVILPNPFEGITILYKPVTDFLFRILE